jgi:hypothetical protein
MALIVVLAKVTFSVQDRIVSSDASRHESQSPAISKIEPSTRLCNFFDEAQT